MPVWLPGARAARKGYAVLASVRVGQEEPHLQIDCCTTSHFPFLVRLEAQRERVFGDDNVT